MAKSLFISLYVCYLTFITVVAITIQITEGLNLIWLGALLTVLPMMLFFIRVFIITDLARTKDNLPLISTVTVIGLIISVITFIMQSPVSLLHINTQGLFAAIIGGVTYALYLLWYSKLNRLNSTKLMVKSKLPNFELLNTEGKTVTSTSFVGSKSLLIFYRGNWCPLCMAQIKEVAKSYEKLNQLGVAIYLISPQPQSHSQRLAAKFKVAMQFFTDNNNQAAELLGIKASHGTPTGLQVFGYDSDTVLPTVIITNEDNQIIYSDLTSNYRVRPHPDDFIEVIRGNQ